MVSLNFKILKSRRKSSGKYGIYLAITHLRQVRYISTEFEVDNERQFKNGTVCSRKDAKEINCKLNTILHEYSNRLDKLDIKVYNDCASLKNDLLNDSYHKEGITLKDLFDARIKRLMDEGRSNYARMHRDSLRIYGEILGNPLLCDITKVHVKRLSDAMKNGYSNSNRQMKLAHLKAAINEAIEKGIVEYERHPFSGFTMPSPGVDLRDVSIDEFIRIRDLKDVSKRISFARDMFLLSFYLGGINLIDLIDCDLGGTELNYSRKKTRNRKNGESITSFHIPEQAKKIIKKHAPNGKLIWPGKTDYINMTSYINNCFSLLKAEIGVKKLSFYSARKTFTQFAFMLGIKTEVIEYCIGQTMKTNRPIYNYVRVMQRQADMCIKKVIAYTENPDAFDLFDGF